MTAEHQHGCHHDHAPAGRAVDPVCGMTVDPHTAKHRAEHQGHTYYFCSAGCRVGSHREEVGRVESIRADVVIDRPMRDALIEIGELNMQDEHDPAKVRQAFNAWCRKFAGSVA